MRRLLSILGLAVVARCAHEGQAATRGAEVTTTVYVGRHFEVRDHDQPVKYVFNGDTRAARITGSLSSNLRLQRWRLHAGWNSVSLAVTATNLQGQLRQFASGPEPLVQGLYRWQPATRDYAAVVAGQTLPAGSILWLRARAGGVVTVAGSYLEPAAPVLESGGGFIATAGLQRWTPTLPAGALAWKYDAGSGQWRAALGSELAEVGDLPPTLAPGEVLFVHTAAAVELVPPAPAQSILYYHSDHLGSPAVVTDANGAQVRESTYYPFGALRHDERAPEVEPCYGFAQKETDPESGLADFGHRLLHPTLGRWLNPDPKGESGGGANPYAYVNQNPLKFEDPDGAEITVTKKIDASTKTVTYHIHLKAAFIDSQQNKFSPQERARFIHLLKCQIAASYSGSAKDVQRVVKKREEWNFQWATTIDMREVDRWSEIRKDEHAFQIVGQLREHRRGETMNGGMLISLQRDIYNPPAGKRTAEETGAHEFGHAAGLGHDNRKPNLMMEGNIRPFDTGKISLYQIQGIYDASINRRLNQREPDRVALDKAAERNP
ncbi:MAG TPA: RHS repeat-associated core domain-containing protein [Candidatus Saccharimonadales bacterium]|nr:RHS repeat-associated core domain-containing protein [Candidatus Saccharimonadales bacterium]